jgi:type 1 glutamine amidotransferase
MSTKRALILWGGWNGHEPEAIAQLFAHELRDHGFEVELTNSLEPLADESKLASLDLIFPCWTMGQLSEAQSKGLQMAIRNGTGLGGIHGGMGDAFRGNLDYEWMVGGHFVGHPHVGDYTVRVTDKSHEITAGTPFEFAYKSEQYYLLIDPGIHVLADSSYLHDGRETHMPVVWTKHWGQGRVFYNALGHSPREFTDHPHVRQLTVRGLLWATRRKES